MPQLKARAFVFLLIVAFIAVPPILLRFTPERLDDDNPMRSLPWTRAFMAYRRIITRVFDSFAEVETGGKAATAEPHDRMNMLQSLVSVRSQDIALDVHSRPTGSPPEDIPKNEDVVMLSGWPFYIQPAITTTANTTDVNRFLPRYPSAALTNATRPTIHAANGTNSTINATNLTNSSNTSNLTLLIIISINATDEDNTTTTTTTNGTKASLLEVSSLQNHLHSYGSKAPSRGFSPQPVLASEATPNGNRLLAPQE